MKKVRLGLSQRLNIGDYESVEVHVEIEEDLEEKVYSPSNEVISVRTKPVAALSEELSNLFEKEAIARLTEVAERRAGNTPAGELQAQIRAAASKK